MKDISLVFYSGYSHPMSSFNKATLEIRNISDFSFFIIIIFISLQSKAEALQKTFHFPFN